MFIILVVYIISIILYVTIATNTSNKGLEYVPSVLEIYSFQCLESDTNRYIESIIIRNTDISAPQVVMISSGTFCVFATVLIDILGNIPNKTTFVVP